MSAVHVARREALLLVVEDSGFLEKLCVPLLALARAIAAHGLQNVLIHRPLMGRVPPIVIEGNSLFVEKILNNPINAVLNFLRLRCGICFGVRQARSF